LNSLEQISEVDIGVDVWQSGSDEYATHFLEYNATNTAGASRRRRDGYLAASIACSRPTAASL
jgi:hypothetical protein